MTATKRTSKTTEWH